MEMYSRIVTQYQRVLHTCNCNNLKEMILCVYYSFLPDALSSRTESNVQCLYNNN